MTCGCFGISCLSLFLGFGGVGDYMLRLVTWLDGSGIWLMRLVVSIGDLWCSVFWRWWLFCVCWFRVAGVALVLGVFAAGLGCVFCCWGFVVGLLPAAFMIINSVGSCISFGLI